MTNTLSDDEKKAKLIALIRHFDTAMLVTQSSKGGLHSRPLAVAEAGQDGPLSFSTAIADPSLAIVLVEPEEASYWDTSGGEGFKYLFEAAKAYVTGARPDSDYDDKRIGHVKL